MTQIFISWFFLFTHEQMFEEKLAILCNEKRQLIDDMRTRCPSHRFYKFKRNLSDFLFRGGACEGLNAMFVDLIWAFGLHAALYSCGTLHLREFARVFPCLLDTSTRVFSSLSDPSQSHLWGAEDIKAGCSLSSSSSSSGWSAQLRL